jgi:uncharacterized membrane protein YphA (DoxX/SURF4 family)
MKNIIAKFGGAGTGLLIIRLGVGAVFLAHGISKLQNMQGIVSFFGLLGLSAFWAYVVTIVETVGGVSMILGFFTQVMGVLLAIEMVVAIFLVKMKVGFIVPGGYEIDLMLFAASLGIALSGPGKWAVGKHMCGCNDCMVCGAGKCGCDCNNCTTCKVGESAPAPMNKDTNLM